MAASAPEVGSMMARVARECGGHISASQEDALATSPFLGGHDGHDEEAFDLPQQQQQQQQEEDTVTMCTLPSRSPSPSPSPAAPSPPRSRKPRVCVRKVRGAKIRTPTPSPDQPTDQHQQPAQPPEPEQQLHADPLYSSSRKDVVRSIRLHNLPSPFFLANTVPG